MNKKNIFKSIIVIFAIIFIANSVFAIPGQKGEIPEAAKALKGDIIDLKIIDVNAFKYPAPKKITLGNSTNEYCGEITVKTNIKSSNDSWAIGILVSSPLQDKSFYPLYMDELYSTSEVGKTVFFVRKISYFYSPGSKTDEFISYVYASSELCKKDKLDVYVFKPHRIYFGYQDNVYVYFTQQSISGGELKNLSKGKVSSFDLKDNAKYLYHKDLYLDGRARKSVYFYNLDYAYDVPFTNSETPPAETPPAETLPAETPSAETPSAETPPAETPPADDTTASQTPAQFNFTLNNLPMISEIKYKLAEETNYRTAKKINDSGIFLVDYLDKDKDFTITLPSQFNQGDLYVLVRQSDNTTEETTNEINNILATDILSKYAINDNYDISKIDSTKLNKIKYTLDSDRTFKFKATKSNRGSTTEFIFMQPSGTTLNVTSALLYLFDHEQQSEYQLCEINKKILKLYCNGYDCNNLDISCLPKGDLTTNVTYTPIDSGETKPPATPEPPKPPAQPTPTQTGGPLEKGADGCYTTNPETLARIRQEGAIGITKQQFSGKRTRDSIVYPGTSDRTDDDPSLTVDQIRKVFNRSTLNIPQKVKDASPAFYNLGLIYNVDPVYSLAFFRAEKSLFNQNSPSVNQTLISHNDISGVTQVCRCGGEKVPGVHYCSYPTLEQGIEAFYKNLEIGTSWDPNLYKNKPFSQVAKTWSGKDSYVTNITTYLSDTYVWAGK